jgi:ABC-type antimicrobial peptide transport system permease subunit
MGDGKYVSMTEDPLAYFVLPYAQATMGLPPTLIIRSAQDPHRVIPEVRRTIASLAPDLPNVDVRALADEMDPQLQPYRIGAVLFTAFGIVALGLAAIGLYGVVAYVVAQRTQEAGVRLALGARAGDVLGLMVRQGMRPALLGAGIGVGGALVITRLFRSQLYGVSPTDPLTLIVVALALCGVAMLACYVPARRAARIDPVIALRSE